MRLHASEIAVLFDGHVFAFKQPGTPVNPSLGGSAADVLSAEAPLFKSKYMTW